MNDLDIFDKVFLIIVFVIIFLTFTGALAYLGYSFNQFINGVEGLK